MAILSPQSITQSYLSGRRARLAEEGEKQRQEFQGLQMERLDQQISRERKQQQKADQLRQYEAAFLTGDEAARERAVSGFAGLGAEGLARQTQLEEFQRLKQQRSREVFQDAFQVARNLPQERQQEAYQGIVASAVDMGVFDEDTADELSFIAAESPERFERAAGNLLGLTPKAERLPTGGVKTLIGPDGTQRAVDVTDPAGRQEALQLIDSGFREAPKRQETGEPGSFTKSQEGGRELSYEQYKTAIGQTANLVNRLRDQLEEGGSSILGIVGSGQRLIGEAGAQIDALAEVSGIDLSPSDFDFESFDADAVKSSQLKSNLTKLSYLIAKARDPSGRVAKDDVQAALNEIGSSGDPRQFAGTLEEVIRGLREDFNIRSGIEGREETFETAIEPFLPGRSREQTEELPVLRVGDVVDGHRYLGGDPSNQLNFEKLE